MPKSLVGKVNPKREKKLRDHMVLFFKQLAWLIPVLKNKKNKGNSENMFLIIYKDGSRKYN